MGPPFQRAAGWCKAVRNPKAYPLRAAHRTEILVGCAGSARYSAYECRENGTRVVPQRLQPLSLARGAKAVFSYVYQTEVNSNGL